MASAKNEIIQFYRRDLSVRFSKKKWLDIFCHACVGMAVGMLIVLIRDTNPIPVLLLCSSATAFWGLRNYSRKKQR